MSEMIRLNQDKREVVRGLEKDSRVVCSETSAADVYVHVITREDTAQLHRGDSTVVKKMTRTRFRLFRVNPGDAPFSAAIRVIDLPDDPEQKSAMLMSAFSLMKQRKRGVKFRDTKTAATKGKPKPRGSRSSGRRGPR